MSMNETRPRPLRVTIVFLCSLLLAGISFAAEQEPTTKKTPTDKKAKPSKTRSDQNPPRRAVDKDVERNVLQMVNDHLPDIKVLLDQLREKEPSRYELAVRNLAKSSRRLQAAKSRGEESFEFEIHVVQAQSAINLLIAKLRLRDNAQDRKALLEATRNAKLAEFARAEHELSQLQSRLERMKVQFDDAEKRLKEKQSKLDENISKDFRAYLRKSGRKE